jgi:hypothetical protein
MSSPAAEAFQHVSNVLAFRAFPFAAYATLSSALSLRARLLVVGSYIGGIAALGVDVADRLVPALLGGAYYLLIASLVPRATEALRAGRVTRGALFVAFAAAYLLFPAVLLPLFAPAFLVLGWDLLLSSYSYCVDTSNSRSAPSSSDCLFFLFVNPTLTYSNRGLRHGPPDLTWRPVGRVALGAATIFVCSAVLRPAYRAMPEVGEPIHLFTHPVASLLIAGSLRLSSAYAAHSGLASIQIGFMNLLGHRVPERYKYPLLATSPLDFWRRWNTYVGSWLGKYVFVPSTRRLQSTLRAWSKGAALFLTFVASGVLHDGYAYASTLTISTKYLQLFATSGITVLLWLALSSARAKTSLSARRIWRTFARPMPRFATLLLVVLAAARWGG